MFYQVNFGLLKNDLRTVYLPEKIVWAMLWGGEEIEVAWIGF
jgi:hypothetical protein